jgi:hypothetical protein
MEADDDQLAVEQVAVRTWRYDEAIRAGLTGLEAAMFAESDRDLSELRRLVEKGATAKQIAAIVL